MHTTLARRLEMIETRRNERQCRRFIYDFLDAEGLLPAEHTPQSPWRPVLKWLELPALFRLISILCAMAHPDSPEMRDPGLAERLLAMDTDELDAFAQRYLRR